MSQTRRNSFSRMRRNSKKGGDVGESIVLQMMKEMYNDIENKNRYKEPDMKSVINRASKAVLETPILQNYINSIYDFNSLAIDFMKSIYKDGNTLYRDDQEYINGILVYNKDEMPYYKKLEKFYKDKAKANIETSLSQQPDESLSVGNRSRVTFHDNKSVSVAPIKSVSHAPKKPWYEKLFGIGNTRRSHKGYRRSRAIARARKEAGIDRRIGLGGKSTKKHRKKTRKHRKKHKKH